MGKITPIISHRASNYDGGIGLPRSNPFIVEGWEWRHKDVCREDVLKKYRTINGFLSWVGYSSSVSSSSGYATFDGGFQVGDLQINQKLVYVHSMIYQPGTWDLIGFKYGISFIEWVQDKGIINIGSIDNISEYAENILTFNKMLRGDDNDKKLATQIMLNNIKGIYE